MIGTKTSHTIIGHTSKSVQIFLGIHLLKGKAICFLKLPAKNIAVAPVRNNGFFKTIQNAYTVLPAAITAAFIKPAVGMSTLLIALPGAFTSITSDVIYS